MDCKYCERCKKMYTIGTMKLCEQCSKELEDSVKKIRDYLNKYPHANVKTVSEETEVSERDILYLIRSDRVILKKSELTCAKCGASISSGKFCDKCQYEMTQQFSGAEKAIRAKQSGVVSNSVNMGFIDNRAVKREAARREAAKRMLVVERRKKNDED